MVFAGAYGGGGGEPSFAILDEVDTGQTWTDGKPIFRKGYTGTAAATNPEVQINTAALGVDAPIRIWMRIKRAVVSTEDQFITFPGSEQPAVAADMFIGTFRRSEIIVQCGAGSATYDGDPFTLFAYYTKL